MSTETPRLDQRLGHVLLVCGDQSGVGKTSICIGIMNELLNKYDPAEIAYIKPCTQCEGVQLLWKFCNQMKITCRGIGPIVYRAGYTQECIDGKHGTAEDRLQSIVDAVMELRRNHKFVLVDGVGYPGVGSCVGCSNRDYAARLKCPVLMISRPGVGNMIDSCVMNVEYMAYKNVQTIGTIVNKIPTKVSYHTPQKIIEYATKFFTTYTYTINTATPTAPVLKECGVAIYGFVPSYDDENDGSCATSCATSCTLKPNVAITEFDLEMDDYDYKELTLLLKAQKKADIQFSQLFNDVAKFFQ